jgi:hypothetical protein
VAVTHWVPRSFRQEVVGNAGVSGENAQTPCRNDRVIWEIRVQGNLEINSGSLLTGGGTLYNNGHLQLAPGSSTMGLGAYVQGNSGTLAIEVSPMGMYTALTVTGTAQLSGTLALPGYVPAVGDSFTVVTAASGLSGHFDSIPDGMVETDTDTSASVTQVDPPA